MFDKCKLNIICIELSYNEIKPLRLFAYQKYFWSFNVLYLDKMIFL